MLYWTCKLEVHQSQLLFFANCTFISPKGHCEVSYHVSTKLCYNICITWYHNLCPPAFHLPHPSDSLYLVRPLQFTVIYKFYIQPSEQNKLKPRWPVLVSFICTLPQYFLQGITKTPYNGSMLRAKQEENVMEVLFYLSPAKWESLKLEFWWAFLEKGPRATLPQLTNAEGKHQTAANITIGEKYM